VPAANIDLRIIARRIFTETLAELDAARAVRRAVHLDGDRLRIFDAEFDVRATRIYSVALGKAAGAMAFALDEILGECLLAGVVSAPPSSVALHARWRTFAGGHPLPNRASLDAARAAFDLLRRVDEETSSGERRALVVFLISGGGSAMLELPRDARVTLEDLRALNDALVKSGANIAEINVVRRAISAVKGGGLARAAPRAAQVTLIVSDVNANDERTVASAPTFTADDEETDAREAQTVVARYRLAARLPASILQIINQPRARAVTDREIADASAARRHFVLLDNARAVERAAEIARGLGFAVEVASDLVEQNVEEGARLLVSRLFDLRKRVNDGRAVCLVSGGEFACPVRGAGVGGRNSETALRCALELDARIAQLNARESDQNLPRFVALSAGTDGVDGNSPAAGALCDETTIRRARARGLDPRDFLARSDSYTFFNTLGDAITTGATGTNVRDLRILISKDEG
jgi:hydroxypyruvate reductase